MESTPTPTAQKRKGSRSTARKWLGRITYVVYVLLLVEVSLQGFYYLNAGGFLFSRMAIPIFVNHSHSKWAVQPNLTYHHATPEFAIDMFTNKQGFRVSSDREEFPLDKGEAVYRVMVLGPSFAFGWGVNYEDMFTTRLQELLSEADFANGRRIEIINRGVPSLTPALSLKWFQEIGKEYQPDLVILFMYGSVKPNLSPYDNIVVDKRGFLRDTRISKTRALMAQAKKSATVFYAWTVYSKFLAHAASSQSPQQIEGAGRELSFHDAFAPESEELIPSHEFYSDLRETMEATDTRLLVFHFPLSYVVHREDIARWRHLGVQDIDEQIRYNAAFANYLNQEGIRCHNATADFIEASERPLGRLYYWLDVHWTPAGNQVAAESVVNYLLKHRPWALRLDEHAAR